MVKTKSQQIFEGDSYFCRSYRGKTGRGTFFLPLPSPPPPPPPPILNRVKELKNLHLSGNLSSESL